MGEPTRVKAAFASPTPGQSRVFLHPGACARPLGPCHHQPPQQVEGCPKVGARMGKFTPSSELPQGENRMEIPLH